MQSFLTDHEGQWMQVLSVMPSSCRHPVMPSRRHAVAVTRLLSRGRCQAVAVRQSLSGSR